MQTTDDKNINGKRLKTQMAAKRKISAMIPNISKVKITY